jgi:hypothetical protein
MGWFEVILNSPSYHRIHHAINDKYLDKNFGEIFIIWDKMFDTCAVEEEESIYGALTPVASWNPNKIYWHYWSFLWKDAVRTKKWWDKLRLWFMPLGWRPEDCRQQSRHRVNEKTLVKFTTPLSPKTKSYLIVAAVLGTGLMFVTINLNWPLQVWERVALTGVLWLMITNWGGMLENKAWAVKSDLVFVVLESLMFSYLIYRFELKSLQMVQVMYFTLRLTLHAWWRSSLKREERATAA